MILVAAPLLAAVVAWALWRGLAEMFERPTFRRRNYRDVELATAAGVVVALGLVATTAAVVTLAAIGPDAPGPAQRSLTLTALAVSGFALLGLLDDVALDSGSSGFRGHLRALASGRLSAGSLKLLAGPAVAVVAVQPLSEGSLGRLLLDGAVVALAANTANLFDRAPGRVTKVSVLCATALAAGTAIAVGVPYELLGVLVTVAAALGILVPEMREELMLGDTGANALGAALGLGVVLATGVEVRVGVLVALVALNVASELVSFSSVIDRVAPLRTLDRLGRRPG